MFSHNVLLILLTALKYSRSDDCVPMITKEDAWDKLLHKDKMVNYRISQPPRNQSFVPVKVHFQLRSLGFDEYEGKFTAIMWTRLRWSDERLTWSPDDYGGVNKIVLHNSNIWMPSLRLLNSVDPIPYYVDYGDCIVNHHGKILCVPQLVYESFCDAKLRDWPYDFQNCSLQFGSDDKFDVTRFSFAIIPMSVLTADYGNGWNIMLMDPKENSDSDVQLSITLTMMRQASGLVVILVVPCLILCILTISPISLNVDDYTRLGLLCFSLMSHFIFLTAIDEFLPKHSVDTPVILLFVRDSIIVTISSVLFTYVLSKIAKRKTLPFEWVSLVSNKVFDSFVRYLIFPRWVITLQSDDMNVKNKEIWTNLANILNSVYMVAIVIVYIGLFGAYMPKQLPA